MRQSEEAFRRSDSGVRKLVEAKLKSRPDALWARGGGVRLDASWAFAVLKLKTKVGYAEFRKRQRTRFSILLKTWRHYLDLALCRLVINEFENLEISASCEPFQCHSIGPDNCCKSLHQCYLEVTYLENAIQAHDSLLIVLDTIQAHEAR